MVACCPVLHTNNVSDLAINTKRFHKSKYVKIICKGKLGMVMLHVCVAVGLYLSGHL